MKKFLMVLVVAFLLIPAIALAATEAAGEITTPLTWEYLASIAGATAAVLLIVQYTKVRLDKVWKIPTRLYVYVIALIVLSVATAFTTGLTWDSLLLVIPNAFVVAAAAMGSYEITYAKKDKE